MDERVLEQIKQLLSFLTEDSGFELLEEDYDPDTFGNALMVFQSPYFGLRVIRDKGQLFADVGPPRSSTDWHDLRRVLEFLGLTTTASSAFALDELADTLKGSYAKLRDLFDKKTYATKKRELKQFEHAKAMEMLANLRPANQISSSWVKGGQGTVNLTS